MFQIKNSQRSSKNSVRYNGIGRPDKQARNHETEKTQDAQQQNARKKT